jgi:hypothetical protein
MYAFFWDFRRLEMTGAPKDCQPERRKRDADKCRGYSLDTCRRRTVARIVKTYQVGNEVVVHDIHVQPIGPEINHVLGFIIEATQVAAQEAGSNQGRLRGWRHFEVGMKLAP